MIYRIVVGQQDIFDEPVVSMKVRDTTTLDDVVEYVDMCMSSLTFIHGSEHLKPSAFVETEYWSEYH